jgi:hypothetical protein
MESRDLLMSFRFNDEATRRKIGYWFEGKNDNAWKPDHARCEAFIKKIGGSRLELETHWSMFSALSHPTLHASRHSAALSVTRITRRPEPEGFMDTMVADYLTSISRLILFITKDHKEWISLDYDLGRMPTTELFSRAELITMPILNQNIEQGLPEGSYRTARDKSATKAELKKNPPQ